MFHSEYCEPIINKSDTECPPGIRLTLDLKADEIHGRTDLHLWRNLLRKRLRRLLLAFRANESRMGHYVPRKRFGSYRIVARTLQQVGFTFLSTGPTKWERM